MFHLTRDIVCLRSISINTLHKGDDDDDDRNISINTLHKVDYDDDNSNNNNNNSFVWALCLEQRTGWTVLHNNAVNKRQYKALMP